MNGPCRETQTTQPNGRQITWLQPQGPVAPTAVMQQTESAKTRKTTAVKKPSDTAKPVALTDEEHLIALRIQLQPELRQRYSCEPWEPYWREFRRQFYDKTGRDCPELNTFLRRRAYYFMRLMKKKGDDANTTDLGDDNELRVAQRQWWEFEKEGNSTRKRNSEFCLTVERGLGVSGSEPGGWRDRAKVKDRERKAAKRKAAREAKEKERDVEAAIIIDDTDDHDVPIDDDT